MLYCYSVSIIMSCGNFMLLDPIIHTRTVFSLVRPFIQAFASAFMILLIWYNILHIQLRPSPCFLHRVPYRYMSVAPPSHSHVYTSHSLLALVTSPVIHSSLSPSPSDWDVLLPRDVPNIPLSLRLPLRLWTFDDNSSCYVYKCFRCDTAHFPSPSLYPSLL